jgi:valyl-tRNA synthetase
MIETTEYPKKYNPKEFEERLYTYWEEEGKFKPRESTTGEQFYISMPPPNVTAKLHIGHSLGCTLQDIMTRYHRMK